MSSPQPQAPYRIAAAGMIAMAVAMGIGRFIYTPILPAMMEQGGLSAADAGLVASANYLGYLAGAIVAAYGWAAGRERAVMLASLLASGLLAGAMAAPGGIAAWLVIRFAAGVASAFVMIFVSTIVFSHLAARQRDDLQSVHFGGVGVGISLSSLTIGALAMVHSSWEAGWLAGAALSLAGFAAVALMVTAGPLTASGATREPPVVWTPPLLRLTLSYGLFGAGYIVTATFLIAIVRAADAAPTFEALVWLVAGLAGIPSVFIWRLAARRLGLIATYCIGSIVEAIGVSASVAMPMPFGPLLGAALLGGTFIAVTALGLQVGRMLAGPSPRGVLALMTAAFGIGQILGPLAAGYLADHTGSFFVPSIGASLVLVVSAAIAWTARS